MKLAVLLLALSYPLLIAGQEEVRRRPAKKRGAPTSDGKLEVADDVVKRLTSGKVPVLEFLKFIQFETGKPVLYPSAPTPDAQFGNDIMVDILGDIEPLTFAVVESILETNGYTLHETDLEDGSAVIVIGHRQSRRKVDAPATPTVYRMEDLPAKGNPIRLATMTVKLKHTTPNAVIGGLRDVMGVAGRGSRGTLTVVSMSGTDSVVITGKLRLLRHIKELIKNLDRATTGHLGVFELDHARPSKAAKVLEKFFGKSRKIRLAADDRSGKLFFEGASEEEVALATEMVAALDTEEVKHVDEEATEVRDEENDDESDQK